MKKLVTVLACTPCKEILPPNDEVEVLYTDENRTAHEIIENGLKQARSKYIILTDGGFEITDLPPLLDVLRGSSSDIVTFIGGAAVKSGLFKGALKGDGDKFTTEFFAVLGAKSIENTNLNPFTFNKTPCFYEGDDAERLKSVLDEFKKCKARLPKDVFTYAFDLLCEKLIIFYSAALIAVHKGEIPAETLKEFDLKLKQNIVLYIAMQKRFKAANLQKLREKNFKINFLTCNKLKKSLNGKNN